MLLSPCYFFSPGKKILSSLSPRAMTQTKFKSRAMPGTQQYTRRGSRPARRRLTRGQRVDWRRRWYAHAGARRMRGTVLRAATVCSSARKLNTGTKTTTPEGTTREQAAREHSECDCSADSDGGAGNARPNASELPRERLRPRRVRWPDNEGGGGQLITVHIISQSRLEAIRERTAENLRDTIDLVCRYFDAPVGKGGCGAQWKILMAKAAEMHEPDYATLGRFWAQRYGSDTPRPGEQN